MSTIENKVEIKEMVSILVPSIEIVKGQTMEDGFKILLEKFPSHDYYCVFWDNKYDENVLPDIEIRHVWARLHAIKYFEELGKENDGNDN